MRRLIHFDRQDAGVLHCDNEQCNHDLDRGAVEWGEHLIGMPCPMCGESLLTREDYMAAERLFLVIEWMNKWFSWVPYFSRERNAPGMVTIGAKVHAGKIEIAPHNERTTR